MLFYDTFRDCYHSTVDVKKFFSCYASEGEKFRDYIAEVIRATLNEENDIRIDGMTRNELIRMYDRLSD